MTNLICSIEDWVQWTTIIANIATCIASFGIIAVVAYFGKKVFPKSKFKAEIFLTAANLTQRKVKAIYFDITFKNLTDKELTVTNITIKHNGKDYPVFRSTTDTNDIRSEDLLTNLPISSYKSNTFQALFFGEKEVFSKVLPIKLVVETTRKTFTYKKSVDFNTEVKK